MNPERTLYPCYFDSALTRRQGRRVPREMAREAPQIRAIHKAAKRAGLSARIDEGTAHPAHWQKKDGRVIVEWKGSKEELMKKIATKF
ncbi:signal recognition particle subunit SRP19/SEC65 family protein [Methanogenium sp. S4BF]|uniref:signal recognition particle subunit SRP19/SEC65 family protein n=1 Tax=Methanogenium sp. S4BF TaxID=1789226 RepID=UPI002415EE10|nr:signal recognition particle subunit SRP19/SEC65 family protein [Methanogenium sp. S4BF]WFN33789.1 signal recognition particle subunit SRP19/SEC65 family protein [Methanogenium sp. S4BF]